MKKGTILFSTPIKYTYAKLPTEFVKLDYNKKKKESWKRKSK